MDSRPRLFAALAVTVLALVAPRVAAGQLMESEDSRPEDATRIRQSLQRSDDAMRDGDFQLMTAMYADDYFALQGYSREQAIAQLEAYAVRYTAVGRDNIDIRFFADAAIVYSRVSTSGGQTPMGTFSTSGSHTTLWMKYDEGWWCVADMPSRTRSVFHQHPPVRVDTVIGFTDHRADMVILFKRGVTIDEVVALCSELLEQPAERFSGVSVLSYSIIEPISDYPAVSLDLDGVEDDTDATWLVKELLLDGSIHRIFEDIAPDEIVLGE